MDANIRTRYATMTDGQRLEVWRDFRATTPAEIKLKADSIAALRVRIAR